MDETTLMAKLVQEMLDAASSARAQSIRVVNLSVCDERVDVNKLMHAFDTLTFTTIAHGARLRVRRDESSTLDATLDSLALPKAPDPIHMDSLELG